MIRAFTYLLVLLVAVQVALADMRVVRRQGPNTISQDYPSLMTAAHNSTVHILRIPKALAQSIVGNKPLLTPTGLPNGYLAADQHIMVVMGTYQSDIRQTFLIVPLRIEKLAGFAAYIPFVDAAGDGVTPFSYTITIKQGQIIPALVANVYGFPSSPSTFEPADAAYTQVGANLYSLQVFEGLENPIDGPGISSNVFQTIFSKANQGQISTAFFKKVVSMDQVRPNNMCDNVITEFNVPFAAPFFARASVQTGASVTQTAMSFTDVEVWSATYMWAYPAGFGVSCTSLI